MIINIVTKNYSNPKILYHVNAIGTICYSVIIIYFLYILKLYNIYIMKRRTLYNNQTRIEFVSFSKNTYSYF